MSEPVPGTLRFMKQSHHTHPRNPLSQSDKSLKKQPARNQLNAMSWRIRARYRDTILHNSIFSLHVEPDPAFLVWLEENLTLMGQEVDSALRNLQKLADDNDEFSSPYLSEASHKLCSLVLSILRSPNQTRLLGYYLNWLIGHWFHVCLLHILRGWLYRASKDRQFFHSSVNPQTLEELLVQHNQYPPLHDCCSLANEASECGLRIIKHLSVSRINFICHPATACQLYEGLQKLAYPSCGQGVPRNTNTHLPSLSLVILLEAQALSTNRVIRQFRGCIQTILHSSPREKIAMGRRISSDVSFYEKHSDRCFLLAGMVTLTLLLWFLLALHYLLTILPERLRYLHFSVESGESEHAIQSSLLTYCLVSPLCVFLNLQLRLYFAHFFITHLPLTLSRTEKPSCLHTRTSSHSHVHKIRLEIYYTWQHFEIYEFRLVQIYQQLCSQMRQSGICVTTISV
ncbi:unnamed protein product [Dicrocoelium dendriticum]|nr:unnamed protein product [Dicrocoelium dendriticum]